MAIHRILLVSGIDVYTSTNWDSEGIYRCSYTLDDIRALDPDAYSIIEDDIANGDADQSALRDHIIHAASERTLSIYEGGCNGNYGMSCSYHGEGTATDPRTVTVWAVNAA